MASEQEEFTHEILCSKFNNNFWMVVSIIILNADEITKEEHIMIPVADLLLGWSSADRLSGWTGQRVQTAPGPQALGAQPHWMDPTLLPSRRPVLRLQPGHRLSLTRSSQPRRTAHVLTSWHGLQCLSSHPL